MTSLIVYLWCIYLLLVLFIDNVNSQPSEVCFWGCRNIQVCAQMNGLFRSYSSAGDYVVNTRRYYVQDDRHFDNCGTGSQFNQVYYLYWRSDLGSLGWYFGFGDGTIFEFGDTNINIRCRQSLNQGGAGWNAADPTTCTVWEYLDGTDGWTVDNNLTVIADECPQAACEAINIEILNTPTPTTTQEKLDGCDTEIAGATLSQAGPYPNMFYSDSRGAFSGAAFFFNYKIWQWGCYGGASAAWEPRCGGFDAGITAWSYKEDFDGLSNGGSITIGMNIFDSGANHDVDAVITCVGVPTSVTITNSPTTQPPTPDPDTVVTYRPTPSPVLLPGQTLSPTDPTAPTVGTTRYPTPPTIDCSKYDCTGNGNGNGNGDGSGTSGDGDDSCAGFSGLCWWWWLLIFLLILCCLCICCILLFKACKKREQNKSKETEMFGNQDDTGNNTGSYQPDDNYNNQYGGNTGNTGNQYGGNQGGWGGGNQGGNQGWGGNQNQYGGGNQYGNQTYTNH